MQTFLVRHTLIFPNGGLAIGRHNKICDKIIHIAKKAFSPNYVRGKIFNYQGGSRSKEEVRQGGSSPETRGDMSTQSL